VVAALEHVARPLGVDLNRQTIPRLRALTAQVERLERRVERLKNEGERLTRWRQATVLLTGLVVAATVSFHEALGGWVLALGLGFFAAQVVVHRRLSAALRRNRQWLEIKAQHRARLLLDWEHLPETLTSAPPDHPFARDLDLFGPRSLQRLLDVAVSRGGSLRLQRWLSKVEPQLEPLLQRQQQVQELTSATLFRDKLRLRALLAGGQGWDGERLIAWLQRQSKAPSLRLLLSVLSALAALDAGLFALQLVQGGGGYVLLSLLVYASVYLLNLGKISPALSEAATLEQTLQQFADGFGYLERYGYRRRPRLAQLCVPFLDAQHRPSSQLRRVGRVVSALGVRANPLVWLLLNLVVPWDLYFYRRLNRCKATLNRDAPRWFETWYELEALCSLANFADLNPQYAFPELGLAPSPVVDVAEMGHPLIPKTHKVCNDFRIDTLGSIVIITGSNMAGKSTFLRTVGINLCLAYAGAPVNARRMRVGLLRLFTCIQLNDSLADGFSYFYAEVRRLKRLLVELEESHDLALLFLIDEIFRGTNNRERLLGSRAYVRALVGQNGVGLISTHDLELAQLQAASELISNVHFKESVEDGKMRFDYTLNPGPCPTTNALTIMRLEGLPVELPPA